MSALAEKKKEALLHAAVYGAVVEVGSDCPEAQAFAEWVDAKAALALAERMEASARARVDAAFVTLGASAVVTPTDTFMLQVREREGIDKDRIPKDVLDAAKVTVRYVQLLTKEGGRP